MSYASLANKQAELIRKAVDGSVFVAPGDSDLIETLTTYAAGPPVTITPTPLPTGYEDLGWFTTDGVQVSRESTSSNVSSFGSVTPTRSDLLTDTSTITVAAQETNITSLSLATGADLAAIEATANSGEVQILKPVRPNSRNYRLLTLFVDEIAEGEIYMARFFPRAKVTGFGGETYAGGDEAILRSVTFTAEPDSEYGSAESWLFGGAGWKALLTKMGIPNAS